MNRRIAVGTALAATLLVGSVLAAAALESGPQVGQKVPGAFHPLNVNGPSAGAKACLV